MKFKGTGIWHLLYTIEECCDAIIKIYGGILDDFFEKTSNIFDNILDVINGVLFAIIALPINFVCISSKRIRKIFSQEKALKENWNAFYEWYKNKKELKELEK